MNNQPLFTKYNTLILKGIAILFIAFHNFLFLLYPIYGCNEFDFRYERIMFVLNSLNFSNSLSMFFYFLGYIGIYVFFFLSGYGLSKQVRERKDAYYAIKRIYKLWILMFLGVSWYVIINVGHVDYYELLRKLTMTDSLSLRKVRSISAAWWFIYCLAQLYILFMPLYKFINSKQSNILIILYLYVMTAYIWQESTIDIEYMYRNCIGHLPEFCLGIYLANNENKISYLHKKKFLFFVFVLSLIFFILAQFSKWVWVFNGISALLLMLSLYELTGKRELRLLAYIGKISPYIFIIHGITLRYFFVELARHDTPVYQIFWVVIWFEIVAVIASVWYFSIKYITDGKNKTKNI